MDKHTLIVIGETARNLEVRVNEHSDVNNEQWETAKHIMKHPNHMFSWDVRTFPSRT